MFNHFIKIQYLLWDFNHVILVLKYIFKEKHTHLILE